MIDGAAGDAKRRHAHIFLANPIKIAAYCLSAMSCGRLPQSLVLDHHLSEHALELSHARLQHLDPGIAADVI